MTYDPIHDLVVREAVASEALEDHDGQLGTKRCDRRSVKHDPHVWFDEVEYPMLCDGGRLTPGQVEEFLDA